MATPTPIVIGKSKPGGPNHMVRNATGRTVCSFLTFVKPERRKVGTTHDIDCKSCLRGVDLRIASGDYLKPPNG